MKPNAHSLEPMERRRLGLLQEQLQSMGLVGLWEGEAFFISGLQINLEGPKYILNFSKYTSHKYI